jgi:hypothetical protein
MHTPAHCEVAIKADQDQNHFRKLTPDTVAERASFYEPMQPWRTARPYVGDARTFETFIGGTGI